MQHQAWSTAQVKAKLYTLNATLSAQEKLTLVHRHVDDGPRMAPLAQPDQVYDLKYFDTPERIASIRAILKLIPLFYVPAKSVQVGGREKHSLEQIVTRGYTIYTTHRQNTVGTNYPLISSVDSPSHNIDREETVLAFMMAGVEYTFQAQDKYFQYFRFKLRALKRVRVGAIFTFYQFHERQCGAYYSFHDYSNYLQHSHGPLLRLVAHAFFNYTMAPLWRSLPVELLTLILEQLPVKTTLKTNRKRKTMWQQRLEDDCPSCFDSGLIAGRSMMYRKCDECRAADDAITWGFSHY